MTLSDDRINYLSHLIIRDLKRDGAVYPDETKALNEVKKAIFSFGDLLEKIDAQVRTAILGLKRQVQEGSREWDVLYRQYFDKELAKKGL